LSNNRIKHKVVFEKEFGINYFPKTFYLIYEIYRKMSNRK
jgi:hypothetical protein